MTESKFNADWAGTPHFVNYLRNQLIPDLRESGSDSTADDFEDAATFIETLASGPARLGEVLEAADIRQSQWAGVAGRLNAGETVPELYEADPQECDFHRDRLREAIDSVREFYDDNCERCGVAGHDANDCEYAPAN